MKRPLGEKLQSTKLQQSWYILIAATVLLLLGKLPADAWVAAVAVSQGIYALANVRQHQIYGQPDPGTGVDDP
jgi:hypothetical protein